MNVGVLLALTVRICLTKRNTGMSLAFCAANAKIAWLINNLDLKLIGSTVDNAMMPNLLQGVMPVEMYSRQE